MNTTKGLGFLKGARMGLPVALGYFSVSIAFGLICVRNGLPVWAPILTSLTNFTGTGQFAGMEMLTSGAAVAEIVFTVFVINIRYFLLSLSIAQKLPPSIGVGKRLLMAFGLTDENFAVEYLVREPLTLSFVLGVTLSSFCGWVSGTVAGALLGDVLPAALGSAMGIMLYAMFIAICVPQGKSSKPIACVMLLAVAMACLFQWTPVLRDLSSGLAVIICGVVPAVLLAWLAPMKEDDSADGAGKGDGQTPAPTAEKTDSDADCAIRETPADGAEKRADSLTDGEARDGL